MSIPPLHFKWNGTVLIPLDRFSRLAEQSFTSNQTYRMIVDEERSRASHNQYFSAVHQAWLNLPEHLQLAFPTEEHLRKYALIKAGFCDIKKIVGNRHVAVSGYAIVINEGGVTTVHTAKSQAIRAMGKAEFQRSKDEVLKVLADMIGVTPDELMAVRAA